MIDNLRIVAWNSNGLLKNQKELELLLNIEKIDICLISETHFTTQNHISFKNYNVYHTIHPNNCARGGTAVIIKNSLEHYEENKTSSDILQTTTVSVRLKHQYMSITAIYCPPRYTISSDDFKTLINMHKRKFIIGGDFNAKNTYWGSRLTTTKGRELLKAAQETGCEFISTGKPTYWPTDVNKKPDLIDFFMVRKVSQNFVKIEEGLSLNSDHSPIYLTISESVVEKEPNLTLYNRYTDWASFKSTLSTAMHFSAPILTAESLEVEIDSFTKKIQKAAWENTPELRRKTIGTNYPKEIKLLLAKKRKLRRKWQQTRSPADKTKLNNAATALKKEIAVIENESMQRYLSELSADKKDDYSLWKSTKYLKRPICHVPPIRNENSTWARSDAEKATAFAKYLKKTFTPNKSNYDLNSCGTYENRSEIPQITLNEIRKEIKQLKDKKAPGFDLITAEVLKQLPNKALKRLAYLFNTAIKLKYFPGLWKVAEVIMIPKPGKDPHDVSSYRPISLLSQISKLFEKLIFLRLKPIIELKDLIPSHQFGFRSKHSTLEQVHRIISEIEKALEEKKVCSAVFLDVAQAFDKVWHEGLIYKLKTCLPYQYCSLLESYITSRYLRIKQGKEYSELVEIKAGVPQGSILGPIMYILYTRDLPLMANCLTATFADDTAILCVEKTEEKAARNLQTAIDSMVSWTRKWGIKLNNSKSIHVNFTNKITKYQPIMISNEKVPFANTAKYLGITLDAKLRWKEHIKIKRNELNIRLNKMNWLIGWKSHLSIYNKLLLYKQTLKPLWAYGAQLWGCASEENINVIQRFQNKVLRIIVKAPWYVRNADIHRDLKVNTVTEEIKKIAEAHQIRLQGHVNEEARSILSNPCPVRRLKRKKPHELAGY